MWLKVQPDFKLRKASWMSSNKDPCHWCLQMLVHQHQLTLMHARATKGISVAKKS